MVADQERRGTHERTGDLSIFDGSRCMWDVCDASPTGIDDRDEPEAIGVDSGSPCARRDTIPSRCLPVPDGHSVSGGKPPPDGAARKVSLASMMGPPCCQEHGTTQCCE